MKCTCGIGAKKLCHQCHVEGVHDETGTGSKSRTYYIPLTVLGAEENQYEKEIIHNLQTCKDYLKAYYLLDSTKSEAKQKRIWKETGVNHTLIWLLLPYFDMGWAILGRYMHAICINLMKALITLWRGEFKGLNMGAGNYILLAHIWEKIGEETCDSNQWMPAAFVGLIPNIDTDFSTFTAEASAFWMMHIAPHVLQDRLPDPYYSHLLNLISSMKTCTKFGMTHKEHVQLSVDIYEWCLVYEE
jgi:hypothetical protein